MRIAAIFFTCILGGCSLFPKLEPSLDEARPMVIDIRDLVAYARDLGTTKQFGSCRQIAADAGHTPTLGPVLSGGIEGGAQNLPAAAATSFVVTGLGVAGGAGGAAWKQFDPLHERPLQLLWNCMRERGRASHAYLVIDDPD